MRLHEEELGIVLKEGRLDYANSLGKGHGVQEVLTHRFHGKVIVHHADPDLILST